MTSCFVRVLGIEHPDRWTAATAKGTCHCLAASGYLDMDATVAIATDDAVD